MNNSDSTGHVRQFFIGLILFMFIDFIGFLFSIFTSIDNQNPQNITIEGILPIGAAVVLTIACVAIGFHKKKGYFALGVLMAPVIMVLGIGACNLLFVQHS